MCSPSSVVKSTGLSVVITCAPTMLCNYFRRLKISACLFVGELYRIDIGIAERKDRTMYSVGAFTTNGACIGREFDNLTDAHQYLDALKQRAAIASAILFDADDNELDGWCR